MCLPCALLALSCLSASPAAGAPRRSPPAATGAPGQRQPARQDPFAARPLRLFLGRRWIGDAIAYGPHRDGQRPGGASPSREELRQDLHLMLEHWHLLRLYGAVAPADSILDIIQRERLPMRVMLGIWVQAEERRDSSGTVLERFPDAAAANRREVEAGIRLAQAYPDVVLALCVGNETQVAWSPNRVPPARLIELVREVRTHSRVPVTVADDFNFWNKPESREVARELDFLVTHAHPLWNGRQLEEALAWTREALQGVRAMHPGQLLVLGETGWATARGTSGDQGKLIKGRVGEEEQAVFHDALSEWVTRERVPTFCFEAFDENWKGGDQPDEVEKHWGLFHADRTPKQALARKR